MLYKNIPAGESDALEFLDRHVKDSYRNVIEKVPQADDVMPRL
jgi:hypothetical protein